MKFKDFIIIGTIFLIMFSTSATAITLEYDKEFLFSEALEGYFNDIGNFTNNLIDQSYCYYDQSTDTIMCDGGGASSSYENLTVSNNLSVGNVIDFGPSKIYQNGYLQFLGISQFMDGMIINNDFTYSTNTSNDLNVIWTGGSVEDSLGGKIQIEDTRFLFANLTYLNETINNFENELSPLVSYSIVPESSRDWSLSFDSECYNNRCMRAQGGNEKIVGYSRDTIDYNGINFTNITLSFFLTTKDISGVEVFEVYLDDNEGNVTLMYNTSTEITNQHIVFDVPSLYEGKNNVTLYFNLDAGFSIISPSSAWVDNLDAYVIFQEEVLVNHTYFGGRIGFGSDEGEYAYIDQSEYFEFGEGFKTKLTLSADTVEFIGDVIQTDVTIQEQVVEGDFNISGNIYVGDGFDSGGVTISNSGSVSIANDILLGGDVLVIQDLATNASFLPTITNTFDIGSSSSKWQNAYFNNQVKSNNLSVTQTTTGSTLTTLIDFNTGFVAGNSSHICFGGNGKICFENEI